MKALLITRLMSGFVSSIEAGQWQPSGAPAIYQVINRLDQTDQLDIIFTLKTVEGFDKDFINRKLFIDGLNAQPIIFSGPAALPKILGFFRTYLSECRQCWRVYRYVKKTKPDVVYIDRANVLLGAIIARFTATPVYLRLLGAPPSLAVLLTKPALSHYLYRWAYRSPFRMVLCSRDGSPGKDWMQQALATTTPRKCWINGVDFISDLREKSSLIRVALIGRLNHLKRIDQAIDAILNLPESSLYKIHVDVIGGGELYGVIKQRIKASGYARQFTLHGAIPHDAVLKQLAQNDLLISLNTHGNLTNTVLEAMRCRLALMLPQSDPESGIDVDTYSFIPKNSVIQLSQKNLLKSLTFQLQRLIESPDLVTQYQEKMQQISDKIDTWAKRVDREIQLLQPYDITIVISDLRGGGTQKVLAHLLKQWADQGKHIALITLDTADNDCISLPERVDRVALDALANSRHFLMGIIANWRRLYYIRRAIKQFDSPVVLSFLSTMNVLTVLATRGLSCRLIIAERNDPARQRFGRLWDYLRKKCYRYADVITANTHSAIETIKTFVGKTPCRYLPNPIVLPETIQPATLQKPTILAVGRLHVQKGYDVLLQAFALFYQQHPDWQLLILGEGEKRASLEKQIKALCLENAVQLKGYVDPFPYLAAAQIYTMPSRHEGMPNALLEAMAMAMPAVISDALTGPLDFVQDHYNALVVPVDNAPALAAALAELADYPELREQLGIEARSSVTKFSLEQVLPQWEVLFND